MAFGQSSGPPATAKQLRELVGLLTAAGHSDFRDARGPMGFTQRQAGGKFTRDEADEFIERLEAAMNGDEVPEVGSPAMAPVPPSPARALVSRPKATAPRSPKTVASTGPARPGSAPAPVELGDVPDEMLAAELQRRGWVVLQP